ncbi:MAG: 2OG-Fe(II) oxygenase [Sphingomonadales bacterium]|nr:2OG-Fe(II) oxygenase [Sphingomonadales bacterium]
MPVLNLREVDDYLCFDDEQCAAAGQALAQAYQTATPFPHIVIEDFVEAAILRRVVERFPDRRGHRFFDRDQERLKFQFDPPQIESGLTRNLLSELNSAAFLAFLEAMTGIKGLIPDPYFSGAGLHETLAGGHLGIHADFNVHGKMNLERRLNLLIYLNEDWQPQFGGALELWDKAMRQSCRSVLPTLGTAVVFSTDRNSFHGHPDPLTCPEDRSRRSIATYYYTAIDGGDDISRTTTVFKVRPNSRDVADVSVRVENFLANWMPPRLLGPAKRVARKLFAASPARTQERAE